MIARYRTSADRSLGIKSGRDAGVPRAAEIAVIDDDKSFREALVGSLSSFGYGCEGYASAEDYLQSAGSKFFDCIVADIHMPGMSGLDLMRRLAAERSVTPVILITARSDMERDAQAAGAVCLLKKPFKTNDLIACIEKAFSG
jgi:FixJ family two-component response regulator